MPNLKTYDLFISHAWNYGGDYVRLVSLLDAAPNFYYRNYSAPKDKPLIPPNSRISKAILKQKIENKIAPVNAVLVLSGMYYIYHDWIQFEIELAQLHKKPIISIKPWGHITTPQDIRKISCEDVSWNTSSIVSAIRSHSI